MKVRKKAWHYKFLLLLEMQDAIPDTRCRYAAVVGELLLAVACIATAVLAIIILYIIGVITIIFGLFTGAEFPDPQFSLAQSTVFICTPVLAVIPVRSKIIKVWRAIKDKACTPLEVVDD